jgi:hypothetical protein
VGEIRQCAELRRNRSAEAVFREAQVGEIRLLNTEHVHPEGTCEKADADPHMERNFKVAYVEG